MATGGAKSGEAASSPGAGVLEEMRADGDDVLRVQHAILSELEGSALDLERRVKKHVSDVARSVTRYSGRARVRASSRRSSEAPSPGRSVAHGAAPSAVAEAPASTGAAATEPAEPARPGPSAVEVLSVTDRIRQMRARLATPPQCATPVEPTRRRPDAGRTGEGDSALDAAGFPTAPRTKTTPRPLARDHRLRGEHGLGDESSDEETIETSESSGLGADASVPAPTKSESGVGSDATGPDASGVDGASGVGDLAQHALQPQRSPGALGLATPAWHEAFGDGGPWWQQAGPAELALDYLLHRARARAYDFAPSTARAPPAQEALTDLGPLIIEQLGLQQRGASGALAQGGGSRGRW